MLTEAHFLSVNEAKRLKPSLSAVIISILDNSEEAERPRHLGRFKDHLVLNFEDVYEEVDAGFSGPFWSDQMTAEEHVLRVMGRGERAPELSDALRIVEFLRKHHHNPDPTRLYVHCFGGISRSAAVAEWAAVALSVPLPQLGDGEHSTDGANKRLLRLLDRAAGRI